MWPFWHGSRFGQRVRSKPEASPGQEAAHVPISCARGRRPTSAREEAPALPTFCSVGLDS